LSTNCSANATGWPSAPRCRTRVDHPYTD
jgi:hypothetical protein